MSSRVSDIGALASINDTRLQAGAMSTSATAYPNEATTAEPTTVTVAYDKIDQIYPSVSPTTDTGKTVKPLFLST